LLLANSDRLLANTNHRTGFQREVWLELSAVVGLEVNGLSAAYATFLSLAAVDNFCDLKGLSGEI
jgi:hypothetical protein